MADWTTVPDTNLEPGKPIRSIDGLALRDNPIAIAEGAAGAPRIKDAALDTTVTTAGIDWVLARSTAASAGAVGTYVFARSTDNIDTAFGATKAGSALRPTSAVYGVVLGGAVTLSFDLGAVLSGTWRCMGHYDAQVTPGDSYILGATLWMRIA